MMDITIQGSIVALATPMTQDDKIDWDALANLVDFHLKNETSAIAAVGTTGESATLTMKEHRDVIHFIVKEVSQKIPVIAGTGANSTHEALELTQAAKAAKADACLLVTPYYNKPTQEGLFQHFKKLAQSVSIPQILYNVPGRTGCDLQTDTVERLLSFPNIIGIKEATGQLDRAKELIERCHNQLFIYSGDDAIALEMIRLGAKGNISVTANVAPKQMAMLCNSALQDDFTKAQTINENLATLNKALFVESNPIPVKWALAEMGLIKNNLRLPMTPLDEQHQTVVRQALHKAGVL